MADLPDKNEVAYLTDPGGRTVTVDKDQVGDAQAAGYVPASDAAIKKFDNQVKYGSGIVNPILAGTAAAGRVASFGLTDQLLTKTGAVAPETLTGLKEANPTADTIGTVAGVVAPLAFGDGAGLAGGALEGAEGLAAGAEGVAGAVEGASKLATVGKYLPGRLVSNLGQGAEDFASGLMPAAGDSLASRIVAKAVPKFVGSAVEGAAYGAGDVVSEEALGDPNLTAQSALAHIGLSAVMAGGIGGALGTAEVAIPAAITKAKDTISNVFGKASEGALNIAKKYDGTTASNTADILLEHRATITSLEEKVPGIRETMGKLDPETAKYIAENADKVAAAYEKFPDLTQNAILSGPDTAKYFIEDGAEKVWTDPAVRQKAGHELTEASNKVVKQANEVMRTMNKELAPVEIENLLKDVPAQPAIDAYNDLFEKMDSALTRMKAEPELYNPGLTRRVELIQEGLVRDAGDVGTPAAAFKRMQTLRESLDQFSAYGKAELNLTERNAVDEIRGLRRATNDVLKDEDVFGAQAARKAALDDAQSQWMQLTGKKGAFAKKFMTEVRVKGGVRLEIDPVKVETWLNSTAGSKGVARSQAWGEMFASAKNLVDEAEQSFKNAPSTNFSRKGYDSLLEKTKGMSADAEAHAKATATANALNPSITWGANPVVAGKASLVSQAAHMVPGVSTLDGLIQGGIKFKNTLKSVPQTTAVLAALERTGKAVGNAVDTGVKGLIWGAEKASVARGAAGAAIARGLDDNSAKTYEKRTKKLQSMMASDSVLHGHLDRASAGLGEHAPNTSEALQMSALRGVTYLAGKVPKVPQGAGIRPMKVTPSKAQIGKFNRAYTVVNKPLAILDFAKSGTLTKDDVDAVAHVYPDLYSSIHDSALKELTSKPNKPIPYQQRQQLGILLGQPVDASMSAGGIRSSQAIYGAPSAKDGAQGAPSQGKSTLGGMKQLSIADRALTPGQASAGRKG